MRRTIQSFRLPAMKLGGCTGLRVQHKISKQASSLQGTPLELARPGSYSCPGLLVPRQGTQMATARNCVSTLSPNHGAYLKQSDVENDLAINTCDFGSFVDASKAGNVVPVWQTIGLHLTSDEAFRCMANRTDRPCEIFVEVQRSRNQDAGMLAILNAPPSVEIVAESVYITLLEHRFNSGRELADEGAMRTDLTSEDPMLDVLRAASAWQPAMKALQGSPQQQIPKSAFCGGWVDLLTRRDSEEWDDGLRVKLYGDPVRHMGLVDEVVVIDHDANKVHMVHWVHMDDFPTPALAYQDAVVQLQHLSTGLIFHAASSHHMQGGSVNVQLVSALEHLLRSTRASSPVSVELPQRVTLKCARIQAPLFPQPVTSAFDSMVQRLACMRRGREIKKREAPLLPERAAGGKLFPSGHAALHSWTPS